MLDSWLVCQVQFVGMYIDCLMYEQSTNHISLIKQAMHMYSYMLVTMRPVSNQSVYMHVYPLLTLIPSMSCIHLGLPTSVMVAKVVNNMYWSINSQFRLL